MGRRTQITLTEAQYLTLKRESEHTGLSMSELIRQAVVDKYGAPVEDLLAILDQTAGAWGPGPSGAEMVEKMRPGLGKRLRDVG